MNVFNRYYCLLCFNVWNDTDCIAKRLPCNHIYCLQCLIKKFQDSVIFCPEDSSSHKINPRDLPTPVLTLQNANLEPVHSPRFHHEPAEVRHHTEPASFERNHRYQLPPEEPRQQARPNHSPAAQQSPRLTRPAPQPQRVSSDLGSIRRELRKNHKELKEKFQQSAINYNAHRNEAIKAIAVRKKQIKDQVHQAFSDLIVKIRNTEGLIIQELNLLSLQLEDEVRQNQARYDKESWGVYVKIKNSDERLVNHMDELGLVNKQMKNLLERLKEDEERCTSHSLEEKLTLHIDTQIYNLLPRFCSLGKNREEAGSRAVKVNFRQRDNSTARKRQPAGAKDMSIDQSTERRIIRQPTFGNMANGCLASQPIERRSSSEQKLYLPQAFQRQERRSQNTFLPLPQQQFYGISQTYEGI